MAEVHGPTLPSHLNLQHPRVQAFIKAISRMVGLEVEDQPTPLARGIRLPEYKFASEPEPELEAAVGDKNSFLSSRDRGILDEDDDDEEGLVSEAEGGYGTDTESVKTSNESESLSATENVKFSQQYANIARLTNECKTGYDDDDDDTDSVVIPCIPQQSQHTDTQDTLGGLYEGLGHPAAQSSLGREEDPLEYPDSPDSDDESASGKLNHPVTEANFEQNQLHHGAFNEGVTDESSEGLSLNSGASHGHLRGFSFSKSCTTKAKQDWNKWCNDFAKSSNKESQSVSKAPPASRPPSTGLKRPNHDTNQVVKVFVDGPPQTLHEPLPENLVLSTENIGHSHPVRKVVLSPSQVRKKRSASLALSCQLDDTITKRRPSSKVEELLVPQKKTYPTTEEGEGFHMVYPNSTLNSSPPSHEMNTDQWMAGSEDLDFGRWRPSLQEPRSFSAKQLAKKLLDTFAGCTSSEHREEMQMHNDDSSIPSHHAFLNAGGNLFAKNARMRVLDQQEILKDAQKIGHQDLRCIFEGSWKRRGTGNGSVARYICMHKEQVALSSEHTTDNPTDLNVTWSMPRALIWALDLNVCIRGLLLTEQMQTKSKKSKSSTNTDKETVMDVNNIPSIHLGTAMGNDSCQIFIVFPYFMKGNAERDLKRLPSALKERFVDLVLNPAIAECENSLPVQPLPSTASQKFFGAKYTPAHQDGDDLVHSQQMNGSKVLLKKNLSSIWSTVLRLLDNRADCEELQAPLLFAYFEKLDSPSNGISSPSALESIDRFEEKLYKVIDRAYIGELWTDIRKETTQVYTPEAVPKVFVYRKCCMERYLERMYKKGRYTATIKNIALLRDAVDMRVIPDESGEHGKAGLICSNFFTSSMAPLDMRTWCLQNIEYLESLALDPKVSLDLLKLSPSQVGEIAKDYCKMKRRIIREVTKSKKRPFGIVEEHRISSRLVEGLREELLERAAVVNQSTVECRPKERPLHFWTLKSRNWFNFVRYNAEKFCLGYEWTAASGSDDIVSKGRSLVMLAMLRAFRFAMKPSDLERETALFADLIVAFDENGNQILWKGLGLGDTLKTYGYAWFPAVIDLQKLDFRGQRLYNNILFGHKALFQQCWTGSHNSPIQGNDVANLARCRDYLRMTKSHPAVHQQVVKFMTHICLTGFVERVLRILELDKFDIKAYERQIEDGTIKLTYEGIRRVLGSNPTMCVGNKSAMTRFNDIYEVFFTEATHFTKGNGDRQNIVRTSWQNCPFRRDVASAKTFMEREYMNPSIWRTAWDDTMRETLSTYVWMYPVPDFTAGQISSECKRNELKKGSSNRRKWWSLLGGGTGRERWGKDKWEKRTMADYPTQRMWSDESWMAHIEEHCEQKCV